MSKRIKDMTGGVTGGLPDTITDAAKMVAEQARPVMPPTRGRFLDYRLTPRDVDKIMQSRASGRTYGSLAREGQVVSGFVTSSDLQPRTMDGEDVAVRVVNLKLFLDGNDFHYVQDVTMGPDCGQAQWPVRS